ncbi:unnamed protein product [Linum trigynum]|uniref:Uncharacterized protein n=1 Tax=Linum trigynum TaxID=586398 RepID=A0AAV2EA13_9ROSI
MVNKKKKQVPDQASTENVEEQVDEEDQEPTDITLYARTYKRNDGSWTSEEAKTNYEEMQAIQAHVKADGKTLSSRKIVEMVLKKKVKYGPKETSRTAREIQLEAGLEAERAESERRTKEFEEKIQGQEEKIMIQ